MATTVQQHRPRPRIPREPLTPEQIARKEKLKEEKEAKRKAELEAYRQRVDEHEAAMKLMPPLNFQGEVVFITNYQRDRDVSLQLIAAGGYIGIDFEWYPDHQKGTQNPIELVQVYNGHTCYLWCMWRFGNPPNGLKRLLDCADVLKVGCGLRGSDLTKLAVSGLPVSEPTDKGSYKHLPSSFRDIQDLMWQGVPPPFKSLEHLTGLFLAKSFPPGIKSTKAHWRSIMKNDRVREYAVLDAYATYGIWECTRTVGNEEPVVGFVGGISLVEVVDEESGIVTSRLTASVTVSSSAAAPSKPAPSVAPIAAPSSSSSSSAPSTTRPKRVKKPKVPKSTSAAPIVPAASSRDAISVAPISAATVAAPSVPATAQKALKEPTRPKQANGVHRIGPVERLLRKVRALGNPAITTDFARQRTAEGQLVWVCQLHCSLWEAPYVGVGQRKDDAKNAAALAAYPLNNDE